MATDAATDVDPDIGADSQPLDVFKTWLSAAQHHPHIREATAMTVATTGPDGALHGRVVLCKQWSEAGFVFFTNYQSRKGLDLNQNDQVAAVFYWDALFRQIKISGHAQRISRADSSAYWKGRPRESQLSQYISRQSEVAASRQELERAWHQAEVEFKGKVIPCPAHWGGYLIVPQQLEFWIGRPGRLHDRFQFEKTRPGWTFRRLYP